MKPEAFLETLQNLSVAKAAFDVHIHRVYLFFATVIVIEIYDPTSFEPFRTTSRSD
jgi:hypothetical protein